MNHNITALERAFQLAESGECDSVPDLKKRLQAEGYSTSQIVGRELARLLRGLITVARAKDDVSFPARCSRLLGQFPYGAERF